MLLQIRTYIIREKNNYKKIWHLMEGGEVE